MPVRIAILASICALLCSVNQLLAQTPSPAVPPADELIVFSDTAQPIPRIWVNADYLRWWIPRSPVPIPLVTTGDPAQAFAGALGQSGTVVLLGNQSIGYGAFSGVRVNAGMWLKPEASLGFEVAAFLLPSRTARQTLASDDAGNPPIFLPLNDVQVGEDAFTVAFPQGVAGSVTFSTTSRLWGAEANLVRNGLQAQRWQMSWRAGFRHVNFEERIEFGKVLTDFAGILADPANPGNPEPPGSILTTTDRFRARNQFFGGQIGARVQYDLSRSCFVDVAGKLALGGTQQIIDVSGATTQQQPGNAPTTFPAGLLAGASNSGQFEQTRFSVIPEVEVKLGCQLTESLCIFAGYNLLFWSNVVRPGHQISRTVDERTIPTAVTFTPGFQSSSPPPPSFSQSSFWAHGIVVGLELRY